MDFPKIPNSLQYEWRVKVREDDVVVTMVFVDGYDDHEVARQVQHRMGTDGRLASIKAANQILDRMRMSSDLQALWPEVEVSFE